MSAISRSVFRKKNSPTSGWPTVESIETASAAKSQGMPRIDDRKALMIPYIGFNAAANWSGRGRLSIGICTPLTINQDLEHEGNHEPEIAVQNVSAARVRPMPSVAANVKTITRGSASKSQLGQKW